MTISHSARRRSSGEIVSAIVRSAVTPPCPATRAGAGVYSGGSQVRSARRAAASGTTPAIRRTTRSGM